MSHSTIHLEVEYITPLKAKEYLERNGHNRDVSRKYVRRYRDLMESDDWLVSPDAIAFDTKGRLINGQHRLHAVVESETTQPFLVAKGLSSRTFEVADQGRRRNLAQALDIDGFSNARNLAALVKRVFNFERGFVIDAPVTTRQGLDFAKHHSPKIEEVLRETHSLKSEASGLWRPSCMRFIYFTMLWRDEKNAWDFIEGVATGIGFTHKEDPRRKLRERLQKEARSPDTFSRELEHALSVKAVNKWFRGENVKFLRWSPGQNEEFPRPEVGDNYPFGYFE